VCLCGVLAHINVSLGWQAFDAICVFTVALSRRGPVRHSTSTVPPEVSAVQVVSLAYTYKEDSSGKSRETYQTPRISASRRFSGPQISGPSHLPVDWLVCV
jgi:hypothetical protein